MGIQGKKGALSYATQLLNTNQPIRAPVSRAPFANSLRELIGQSPKMGQSCDPPPKTQNELGRPVPGTPNARRDPRPLLKGVCEGCRLGEVERRGDLHQG